MTPSPDALARFFGTTPPAAKKAKLLKWKRGQEDGGQSEDGLYVITPLYCGRTTPMAYEVVFAPTPYVAGTTVRLGHMVNTKSECKSLAENHASSLSSNQ